MLTLYGEMFLSEYTLYDLNDELDCASTENVIEIQTTNPDYSGTDDHLPSTMPMKNLIYFRSFLGTNTGKEFFIWWEVSVS